MATTKETMKVIADGITEEQIQDMERDELAAEIAAELGRKTAKRFRRMVAELEREDIGVIVKAIEHSQPEATINQFQCLFSLAEMEEARDDLDFLIICAQYNENTFDIFKDIFLEDEYVDWFCVENWLEDDFPEEDNNLN